MRISLDTIEEDIEPGNSNVRLATEDCRSSMLIADSSEYKEGEAAFCRGLTTRNNPYPFLSPEHWCWQEGLLENCSNRTAVESRTVSVDPSAPLIEFLGDEDEAVVAIVDPEYVEPGAVLIGAS
jgi:hypothetical protein